MKDALQNTTLEIFYVGMTVYEYRRFRYETVAGQIRPPQSM